VKQIEPLPTEKPKGFMTWEKFIIRIELQPFPYLVEYYVSMIRLNPENYRLDRSVEVLIKKIRQLPDTLQS